MFAPAFCLNHIIAHYLIHNSLTAEDKHYREHCFFCHPMLCISTAYAVVSVCPSCIVSKKIDIFSHFNHHWVATPFLFLHTKPYNNILMGTPLIGASNAVRVGKNCNSQPISGFGIDDYWRVINSFLRGVKCSHSRYWGRLPRISEPCLWQQGSTSFFCRAMLCKRGLCRHAVSVCLSVTFVQYILSNEQT